MSEKITKTNHSVEKVLHIIEIMAQNREPMRLGDIAKQAEMPASTALRMVNTLLNAGYANQDELSLRYSLSLKFAQIGSLVVSQANIRDLSHPLLVQLSNRCGESCCLAIEQDFEVVYLDVVDGPDNMLKIMQRIGKRAPLHCTGIGKIIMTKYDDEQIQEYIKDIGLTPLTPNSLSTYDALIKELEQVRACGYAVDNEECELGARCIAAGIRDYSGQIAAGISVSGPISRLSLEQIDRIKEAVLDTAAEISKLMAYDGSKSDAKNT